jgi:serine/threonine protein kinase
MTYKPAPIPDNDMARVEALQKYEILDTPPEKAFDDITQLASFICQTPISLMGLIDKNRQWYKSKVGLDVIEAPRDITFCSYTISYGDLFIIPDTLLDDRFKDNPLVLSPPYVRFYIGAPLITSDGYALGTLCAVDQSPREMSSGQKEALLALSRQVVAQFELRRFASTLDKKNQELMESHQRADRIFSALAEALPGTVLDGKYRLDEKIGSGGFGAVYRAMHLAMKRPIAVKVFKPMPGNDSAEGLQRFQREAVSAGRINHPNAVTVLDSGISSEGIAYLVMELLVGHSLAEELNSNVLLLLERCASILIPVCDVVSKAHGSGILHRDIKPDNIFLNKTPAGEVVKVVDFGIAKLLDDSLSQDMKNLTATGGIIGTPIYMAPERLMGQPYDGKSDVYSIGVMLYKMLCGRLPFTANEGGFWAIMMQQLHMEPTPLRKFNSHIPEAVEAIVMKAISKDPSNRPTASELAEEFAKAANVEIGITSNNIKERMASGSIIGADTLKFDPAQQKTLEGHNKTDEKFDNDRGTEQITLIRPTAEENL